jgi:hypothetical protein
MWSYPWNKNKQCEKESKIGSDTMKKLRDWAKHTIENSPFVPEETKQYCYKVLADKKEIR